MQNNAHHEIDKNLKRGILRKNNPFLLLVGRISLYFNIIGIRAYIVKLNAITDYVCLKKLSQ